MVYVVKSNLDQIKDFTSFDKLIVISNIHSPNFKKKKDEEGVV